VAAVSGAESLVRERRDDAPHHGCDQTVRIRVKIRIEHAARREPFDHAQLLNSQQHQCRPDVIEKLNGYEQYPERDFVSVRSACKRNAVMSDKHYCSIVEAFVPNAFLRRLTQAPLQPTRNWRPRLFVYSLRSKLLPKQKLRLLVDHC
jgi:hypothetical protein